MNELNPHSEDWKWQSKLETQIRRREAEPPREFVRVGRAFAAPLREEGRGPFIMATLIFFGAGFIPVAGDLVRFLVCSYVMHAIAHAARGREGLPWWSMEDLEKDFRLSFIFVALNAAAYLPAAAWLGLARDLSPDLHLAGGAALGLAGAFFLPMMLLIGAVSGSFLRALNPSTLARAIGRVFRPYLATVGMCVFSLSVLSRLGGLIPSPDRLPLALGLFAALLSSALGLYCLVVAGLILGSFYYNCLEAELEY